MDSKASLFAISLSIDNTELHKINIFYVKSLFKINIYRYVFPFSLQVVYQLTINPETVVIALN